MEQKFSKLSKALISSQDQRRSLNDPDLREFVSYVRSSLGYRTPAKIRLYDDHTLSERMKAMGSYFPDRQEIWVLRGQRVRADWYRSLAHELVHHKQREQGTSLDGQDGSDCENEANSKAAVFLREWGRDHPEIYRPYSQVGTVNESLRPDKEDLLSRDELRRQGLLPAFDESDRSTYSPVETYASWAVDDASTLWAKLTSQDYKSVLYYVNELEWLLASIKPALERAVSGSKDIDPSGTP